MFGGPGRSTTSAEILGCACGGGGVNTIGFFLKKQDEESVHNTMTAGKTPIVKLDLRMSYPRWELQTESGSLAVNA